MSLLELSLNSEVLHNSENSNSYYTNTENANSYLMDDYNFKNAVAKLVGGDIFDIAIRAVNTNNANPVTIRIKNINSGFSQNRKDAFVQDQKPVVFAGGLFSDLIRWEQSSSFGFSKGLATQLVEEGRDAWEIEITGGPGQDCPACPNYNYSELVDYYHGEPTNETTS